ncbi:MAG: elongation factor P hydroxylase [Pseudomonadota bacterium]
MIRALTDEQIRHVFNDEFADYSVRMIGGASEPVYLPATEHGQAQLFYRDNFAASALHEAAHWCIAGQARRTQEDFGYHYLPPPRSASDQLLFFRSELRTQALESLFADQAGVKFVPSADNLESEISEFAKQIDQHRVETLAWMNCRADTRAKRFYFALGARRIALGDRPSDK